MLLQADPQPNMISCTLIMVWVSAALVTLLCERWYFCQGASIGPQRSYSPMNCHQSRSSI